VAEAVNQLNSPADSFELCSMLRELILVAGEDHARAGELRDSLARAGL